MCDIVSFFYGCVDVLTIVPVLLCICLLEKGYKNVISVVDDCERQLMEIMFGKGKVQEVKGYGIRYGEYWQVRCLTSLCHQFSNQS